MNKRQDLLERVNRLSGRKGNWVGRRKTMSLKIDAKHDTVRGELQPVSHNHPPELVGKETPSPQIAPTDEMSKADARAKAKERMRETIEKAKQLKRPDRFPRGQPFQPPQVPPNVKIGKSAKLAMDEATSWAATQWSSGGAAAVGAQLFNEGLGFMGYPFLAELSQRPEYRVIVETIATDMTRKWIKLRAKSEEEDKTEKIGELMEAMEEFKVKEVFEQCEEIDGYFGRAHLYIDTGDTDDAKELLKPIGNGWNKISQAKFGKGDLKRLVPVEPVWTYPAEYNSNNPLKPDWYNPQRWFVMASEVHQSRLLKFVGREVPDLLKPAYSFGGLALTQMVKPYVTNWLNTRQSVADIVQSFSVFVVATNMQATLQEGGDDALERAQLFNIIRSNAGLFMVDKDTEDFMNVSAPLGTLDQLQAQSQEQMASISRIPLVKLLGISPHGLNATAEPELDAYNDGINAAQEKRMRPNLTRVLGFLMLHLWGKVDEDIDFDFVSLKEATPKEKAEIQKMLSETDTINIQNGTIDPEEARGRIASDPDSIYQGLDPDDMPEPPEPEEGEGGPGAGQPPFGGGGGPGGQPKPDKGQAADAAPVGAGIVFQDAGGRVLLLKRSAEETNYADHWALPGGGAEDGETPAQCAIREAREEIGVDAAESDLVQIATVPTPNGWQFTTFLCRVQQKIDVKLNGEHAAWGWFATNALPKPIHPAVLRVITEGLASVEELSDANENEEADA